MTNQDRQPHTVVGLGEGSQLGDANFQDVIGGSKYQGLSVDDVLRLLVELRGIAGETEQRSRVAARLREQDREEYRDEQAIMLSAINSLREQVADIREQQAEGAAQRAQMQAQVDAISRSSGVEIMAQRERTWRNRLLLFAIVVVILVILYGMSVLWSERGAAAVSVLLWVAWQMWYYRVTL